MDTLSQIKQTEQQIIDLQELSKKLKLQKIIEDNKGKKFRVVSKMFFTSDAIIASGLSYEKALEEQSKYSGDVYEWYDIEKDED